MAGSSQGGETSGPDDLLDSRECQELLANLRLAFAEQRLCWEAVRIGIDLGVEEVQDQRLAELEAPPESSGEAQVFLLLVVFFLEGPFAPALAMAAQGMLLRMLSRRVATQRYAYARLARVTEVGRNKFEKAKQVVLDRAEKAGRTATAQYAKPSRERRERANLAAAELAASEAELKNQAVRLQTALKSKGVQSLKVADTTKALKWLSTEYAPQVLMGGMQTGGKALEDLVTGPAKQGRAEPTQSPGVQLRVQVTRDALAAIQNIFWAEEEYALEIAKGPISVTRAAKILTTVGYGDEIDTTGLIDAMRELSTTVVWAQLAGLGEKRKEMREAQQAAVGRPGELRDILIRLPVNLAKHKKYLNERFGAQAERWALQSVIKALLDPHASDPGYVMPGTTPSDPRDPVLLGSVLNELSGPDPRAQKVVEEVAKGVAAPLNAVSTAIGAEKPLPEASNLPSDRRLDLVLQYLEAVTAGATRVVR